ncbi:MAG: hypothetical protein FWG66_05350, partial [Spirochaetes bacterium]|nr:hypothetical protein [Spirochaetota bacterium]
MSKIRFAFALAFATICILLLLAGCEREQPGAQTAALPPQANTVQEAAAQWAAEQEAAEEPAAEQLTWEEVYAALLRELEQVTDLTWRQAYAALLRELATVINFTQWGWDFFGDFFLHDIDGTGTPNLIVFRPVTASGGVLTHSAYAFEGGVLSPIELGDMPHHLLSLYVPPGDTGIVAYNFFHEGPTLHDWLELEDGIFRRRVSGRSEWLPEV